MPKLFGFSIDDSEKKPDSIVSPVPPNNEDGVDYFIQSGFYGQYVDIEGVYRTEYDLIKRYREMALHPECDNAIEDVVNEAIVSDLYDSPIEIELSNVNASDSLKDKIRHEFRHLKEIMDFDKKSHEIFRNWYIDGRVYYMKVIDVKRPQDGIQELRYIDPMKMKFVRQEKKNKNDRGNQIIDLNNTRDVEKAYYPDVEEYYIYTPKPNYPVGVYSPPGAGKSKSIKIAKDSIAYVTSGLFDRNKLVYNAQTGEVRDDRKFMSMMEDFWLPRREGGRGTEITTLPGGQNLGELSDIEYFQKKLYRALGVPESRIASEGGFNLGRSSEILRDELKFSKFVGRLRKRFGNMFNDMLRTQLILKNIVSPEDWDEMSDHIQYDFLYDNQFAELKETEMMNERLGLAATIEPYIGKYYSAEYLRKKILRQTDAEIKEIDEQIAREIKDGIIPDPNAVDPITGAPLEGGGGDLGDVPVEDDLEKQGAVTDAELANDTKKAEI